MSKAAETTNGMHGDLGQGSMAFLKSLRLQYGQTCNPSAIVAIYPVPVIRYLEVTIRREFGKLVKFKKFEWNLVLYLDTIMRFTQNDLFRRYH